MTTKELKSLGNKIIGEHVECIFTGMLVTGIVIKVVENAYTIGVIVKYDNPHNWGDQYFYEGDASARKFDDFGSLKYLKIID